MGGQTISMSDNKLDALTLQSSCYGATVPWTFGVCQLACNLVWFGGFQSVAHTTTQGGKGGGVKQQNTTYSYAADVILDIGSGRVTSVSRVWRGKSLYAGGATGSQIVTVGESWSVPSSGVMEFNASHSTDYVGFGSITYSFVGNDGLTVTGTMSLGEDYTVTGAGNVAIVNPAMHGVTAQVTYQYKTGTIVTTALDDLGFTFVPGAIAQSPWSGLAGYGNQSIGYSGQAQLAATQYDLGTNAQVENHKIEVVSAFAYHLGSTTPDIDPSLFLHEVLSNTRQGVNFPSSLFDQSVDWSDYCVANDLLVSPAMTSQVNGFDLVSTVCQLTNSQPVWSGGRLRIVPYGDANASAHSRTYTPNTTPIYDLTDEYWKGDAGNPPLQYEIKPPSDRYNHVRIEYLDRDQQYAATIAEARDLTDISASGLRSMDVIPAHWICNGNTARHVAQLIMQRSLFVTTTYTFTLPQNYVFLEPMDLVTLTDSVLGMDKLPVRITQITESDDGSFDIECEDYPPGVCSAALYSSQELGGYLHDMGVPPGNIDIPVIWQVPTDQLPGGVALELYAAARGVSADWGGCDVWLSVDGNNYLAISRLYGASRYGKLTAPVGANASFNQVTSGQFVSGSANDALTLSTLCYIAGSSPEYIAYQNATLTGNGAYTIDGLVRGAYSTVGVQHSAGDDLVRVDDRIGRSGPLDASMYGQNVFLKFTSFNIYGRSSQSLADVAPYRHVITGGSGYISRLQDSSSSDVWPAHTAAGTSFVVAPDGTCSRNISPYGTFIYQNYHLPAGANTSGLVWARVTHLSGDAFSSGNVGTWESIVNGGALYGRAWSLTIPAGANVPATTKQLSFKVEIATDSAGATIVSTGFGTLFTQTV